LQAPDFSPWNLTCDILVSKFAAFKCNLYRYNEDGTLRASGAAAAEADLRRELAAALADGRGLSLAYNRPRV
jgi:hypothetical protein